MTWRGVLFFVGLTLGVAAPVDVWGATLNDSGEPGSVIVFHKFVTGSVDTPDRGPVPATEFEISVTCPKGSTCGEYQHVTLRAHWVCPGDDLNVCHEVEFNLYGTVNGSIVFSPGRYPIPQPPCDRGYLIAWVIDESERPIKFDALIGNAVIRGSSTSARAYNALPIQAAVSLSTGDPTDVNPTDGRLAFDGSEYQAVTGKIFGPVQFENTDHATQTSLTLLTLDVHSNSQNDPTNVDLNFSNAFEHLTSTRTTFTCWQQVRLTDIDPGLNAFDQWAEKGHVESTAALQSTRPVTLLGLIETQEGFTQSVAGTGTGQVTIPYPVDINNLPPGCQYLQGPPSRIKCNVDVSTQTQVPGIREYASSLYNDSTPVATTFCPNTTNCPAASGADQCAPPFTFDPATGTCACLSPAFIDPSTGECRGVD